MNVTHTKDKRRKDTKHFTQSGRMKNERNIHYSDPFKNRLSIINQSSSFAIIVNK